MALAAELAFLSRPRSYGVRGARVQRIETHYSWVFLVGRRAYKLKKPLRSAYADLRSVEARRRNCEEEARVNRRFARDVYQAVVPLGRDTDGRLRLGEVRRAVDWLVRMRRLPAARTLEARVAGGDLQEASLEPVVELLCRVYSGASAPLSDAAYRVRLRGIVDDNEHDLSRPAFGLDAAFVRRLCADQRAMLGGTALDGRASRLVEGHGDLRPEHVFLEQPPVLIDALEFSRELRIVDPVDELGFLALECERLGAPAARAMILRHYANLTGDVPADELVHFYQSMRAAVRARLAIRHRLDPATGGHARWTQKAERYLGLAREHADCAAKAAAGAPG